jgi:hypothetical protein
MRFDIHFTHGPLDGLSLDGDTSDTDADNSFASQCFRGSSGGSIGATFETFDPHLLTVKGSGPTRARLHHYGVESATSYSVSNGLAIVPVHVEVKAVYQGPSDRYAVLEVWRDE